MIYNVWIYETVDITKIEDNDFLVILSDVAEADALDLARICTKYDHNVAMFPIIEDQNEIPGDPFPR